MYENEKKLYEAKAHILKALAHPTRLYMAEQLLHGEKCVCEFVREIDADISTISKHLSILKEAGIVSDEKRGKQVFYHLKTPCILQFTECAVDIIKSNLKERSSLMTRIQVEKET
ncbi:TPA: transcriptional regulator [Candidatus Marinimicrobia bacterium]|nr:MAG: Transcriptional regulator, ArsR family [Marinimicrobia bacterium 46_47]HAE87957.1 transcriptional regulator [Candidatus Neomarinimicrobiota bacterium]HBY17619.1 transcriptional regulator [Candidatus Neomarinimicrobiota bacterium]